MISGNHSIREEKLRLGCMEPPNQEIKRKLDGDRDQEIWRESDMPILLMFEGNRYYF